MHFRSGLHALSVPQAYTRCTVLKREKPRARLRLELVLGVGGDRVASSLPREHGGHSAVDLGGRAGPVFPDREERAVILVEDGDRPLARVGDVPAEGRVAVMGEVARPDRGRVVSDRPCRRPRPGRMPGQDAPLAVTAAPTVDEPVDPLRVDVDAPYSEAVEGILERGVDLV